MNANLSILLLVPVSVLAVTAVVVALVLRGRAARPDPTLVATFEAARSHAMLTTGLAWLAAAATGLAVLLAAPAVVSWTLGVPGLLPALGPTVMGLVLLGVHAVGEVTWPRPTGTVRSAVLVRRTVADVAPRVLRRAMWAVVGAGAVGVGVLGVLAAPDGRSIERTFAPGERADGISGMGAGPFPGLPYGVPMLLGWLVLVVGTEWVLRLVARRPAVVGTAPDADLALRRLSARRVLRGPLLLVAGNLTVVLLAAAGAMARVDLGAAAGVAGALAAAVAVTAVVLALRPGGSPVATPLASAAPGTRP